MNVDRALPGTAILARRPPAAASLAAASVILTATALSAPASATAAAWGGAALAAWCGALLVACSAISRRDGLGLAQWKLGSWILLWYAATSGIASMAPVSGLAVVLLPSSIARAEWLTAVAATAWAGAYCAGPRKLPVAAAKRFMRRMAARRPGLVRSSLTPWLLYGTGTAARLAIAVLTGHLGDAGNPATSIASATWYQQVLGDATLACPLAVAVAGLRAFRERAPGARLTLAVLFAAECAMSAVSASKGGIITAVVAVAIARVSAGRRIPVRLTVAASAFFLVIVIPFTSAYRTEIHGGSADPGQPAASLAPGAAAADAPAIADSALSTASAGTVAQSVNYLGQRLQEIDAPAIVLQKTPSQVPYASPAQLPEALAVDLVPRALWPGKPVIDPGYQFTEEYYGTDLLTYSAITPQADLWRYGGWVSVIAGMAFLGWLMRILDDALDVRGYPQAVLLVLLLWPVLAAPEGSFTTMLAVLPGLVLTWLAVTAAAFGRCAAASSTVVRTP